MAVFGTYETVRELPHKGYTAAHTARAVGGSGEPYLLRSFSSAESFLTPEAAEARKARFLEAAEIQAQAAAGGSHWAKVVESGQTDEGAYTVSEYPGGDLQQFIQGRVRVTPASLGAIVSAVAAGLRELESVCHRPHGNLDPTNVWTSAAEDMAAATVVLADPVATESLNSNDGWAADQRALGAIIFEMVMHRSADAVSGMAVPDSPEWSRLPGWRDLATRLLAAGRTQSTLTLTDLAAEVEQLGAVKTGGSPIKAVAIVVLLAAMGAGGYFAWDKIIVAPPADHDAAAEYVQLAAWRYDWLDELESVKTRSKRVWAGWTDAHPAMKRISTLMDEAGTLKPPKLSDDGLAALREVGRDLAALDGIRSGQLPADAAEKAAVGRVVSTLGRSEDKARDIRHKYKAASDIRDLLAPPAAAAAGTVGLVSGIENTADVYAERGWTTPGKHLEGIAGGVRDFLDGASTGRDTLSLHIDRVLEATATVADIDVLYVEMNTLIGELSVYADEETLAAFDAAARSHLVAALSADADETDILDLTQEQMTAVRNEARDLKPAAEHWRQEVDREAFAKRFNPSQPIALATFPQWRDAVYKAPTKMSTPPPYANDRWIEDLNEAFGELDSGLSELEALSDAAGVARFSAERKELADRREQLKATAWNKTNKDRITEASQALPDDVWAVVDEVGERIVSNKLDLDDHPLRRMTPNPDVQIGELDDLLGQLDKAVARRHEKSLDALLDDLEDLEPEAATWILANKSEIESRVAALSTAMADLRADIEEDLRSADPRRRLRDGHAQAVEALATLGRTSTETKSLAPLQATLAGLADSVEQLDGLDLAGERARITQEVGRLSQDLDDVVAKINKLSGEPDATDPRLGWAWEADRDEIKSLLDELNDGNAYRRRLSGLTSDQAELNDPKGLPWTVANEKNIAGRVAANRATAATLGDDVARAAETRFDEVARSLSGKSISRIKTIEALWTDKVAKLIEGVSRRAPKRLKRRAEQLEQRLVSLETLLPKGAAERRDEAIVQAGAAIGFDGPTGDRSLVVDEDAWGEAVRQYEQFAGAAAVFLADFAAIEDLLAKAYASDETAPDGESIEARFSPWVDDRGEWTRPGVAAPFAEILSVRRDVIRLGEIEAGSAMADELLAEARSSKVRSIRLAAWRQLGREAAAPWPGTVEQMRTDNDIRKSLASIIRSFGSDARTASLLDEIAAETRRRWTAGFERLETGEDITDALSLADELGVELDALTGRAAFLYLYHQFLSVDWNRATDEEALAGRDAFVATLRSARGDQSSTVAELLETIEALAPSEGAGDVSSQLGDSWTGRQSNRGGRAVATFTNAKKITLEFVLVWPATAGKGAYVCTTEVPIRLFLRRMIPDPKADWRCFSGWRSAGSKRIITERRWWKLNTNPMWKDVDPLAPELKARPANVPDADHPMHYVSADTAMGLARELNCRFPTVGEWKAAYEVDRTWIESQLADGATAGVNLRDRSWRIQRDYIGGIKKAGAKQGGLPMRGVYGSVDLDDDTPVIAADDGYLYLAKIAADKAPTFHHLVGNVAEYVLDSAEPPAAIDGPAGPIKIMGASAWSSRRLWNGADTPFDEPLAASKAKFGHCDVGFRLAFTAPGEPMGLKIRRVLRERDWYRR